MKKNTTESGQILVILVLGVFGLLGFTALALDGGMIYSNRRHAQNGSDASSLAGGGAAGLVLDQVYYQDFTCSLSAVTSARQAAVAAAINRAATNGFMIDDDISDKHGVNTECMVYDNGSYVEKYIDVKVDVTSDVNTSLIQYVYTGAVRNEVKSVTRIYPRTGLGYGNAVVSLSPNCGGNDGGVHFDGNNSIEVNGGGVFSNSCVVVGGTSLGLCVDDDTSGSCDEDGAVTYMTTYTENGGPDVDAVVGQGSGGTLPEMNVTPPDCSKVANYSNPIKHKNGGTISPGNYEKINLDKPETLALEPGLYCLHGEFKATGGEVLLTDYNEGVTIYMLDKDFETTGNVEVRLKAPPSSCQGNYCPEAIVGMLIYMADGHDGKIKMEGNAASWFEGTVFAPDGTIDIGGTSSQNPTFNTQLIGWQVNIHGNVNFDIN